MFPVWQRALKRLRDLIPQPQFSQWISPLQAQEGDGRVVIYAPNQYVRDGVNENYWPLIEQALVEAGDGGGVSISFSDYSFDVKELSNPSTSASMAAREATRADSFANVITLNGRASEDRFYQEGLIENNLNSSFTFESFVEGKSNQLAVAASKQICENPGIAYNPVFIYGGVGLGKTHLMQAVGNAIVAKKSKGRVLYLHSERFVANMVKALQENSINEFKRFYRRLDALLIDDIQFFAGKERSQEEFFHTFNALLEGHQQIILTSDRYPKEITGIEERLKSRFGSGLTVAIEPPELETRVAILINKALQLNVELDHEIAFFIAKRIRSNIRELEGVLKRIVANSKFTGSEITLDFVKEALRDLLAIQDKLISIDNIIKTVAEFYKITISELLSKKRCRKLSRPRQIAMYLCKELTEHSLPEIGVAFGGKDHTTVLHACKQINKLKASVAQIAEDIQSLTRILAT